MCRAIEIMINETVCETERAKAINVAKGILQTGNISYEELAKIVE